MKHEEEEKKILNIEDKYRIGKAIGTGAFAVVKLAVEKESNLKFAIKCIMKSKLKPTDKVMLEREMDIMQKLQHPAIIGLHEVLDTAETLYLVEEFASGGELFEAIVNKGSFTEPEAAFIVWQVLDALNYMHKNGVAHRDLKPENLLLMGPEDAKGKLIVKIIDFGLAKDFGGEGEMKAMQTQAGTPDYVAPEVIRGDPYDKEVDLWSLGVITYVILCGFPPFAGDTPKELFDSILEASFDFPDPEWTDISKLAKNFIKHLLVVDPEKRYTAEQGLKDPWIQKFAIEQQGENKGMKHKETFNVEKFKEYTKKLRDSNPNFSKKDEKLG
jgi:calcium/calmodulin-dependent protein kinase I